MRRITRPIKSPSSGHRRKNPLTGEWVLISPQRLDRPWQGALAATTHSSQRPPTHDPDCYLCAGNARINGELNPAYSGVYVFDNDFPALQASAKEAASPDEPHDPLFRWSQTSGRCRVVCFSPDHGRTLSDLARDEVVALVEEWVHQTQELGQQFPAGSVQIFENKGELMGCSNPHPHGQIWAQDSIPTLLQAELEHSRDYFAQRGEKLLVDYAQRELTSKERVVLRNDHFVVVVPYWATWPFETLVCPLRGVADLTELSNAEIEAFGEILQALSIRYDNLFGVPFPYSSGIHQAPLSGAWHDSFCLHMHFYPPLLRSAEIKKFMVGYEMLAEAQRDLTPESAAELLRELPGQRI